MNLLDQIFWKFVSIKRRSAGKFNKFTWKYKKIFKKDDLVKDLQLIKLNPNSVVCVHSSLSRIGRVVGGADTVLLSLLEAFGEGVTLLVPTFTLPEGNMEDTLRADFVFYVKNSRTTLGAIPARAQESQSFRRSLHPTHSFVASGPLADKLVNDHHLSITPTGFGSPLYKMSFNPNAFILLLGSPIGNFTSGHCVQDRVKDFPYRPYSKFLYKTKCIGADGTEHEVKTYAHNTSANKFRWDRDELTRTLLKNRLDEMKILHYYKVGNTSAILINCVRLQEALEKLLDAGITIFGSIDRLKQDPDTKSFFLKNGEIFWQPD